MSIRDQILATAEQIPIEPVEAFNTTVYLRRMNASEVSSFYRWRPRPAKAPASM